MPIAKLNASTARLLGSSVFITSPCAVVKELLENALDAGADAVDVSISNNTLDSIRVRDNGSGVNLEDMDSLGRASHTSKLHAFEELRDGKVQTLGFRGQALASINTISQVQIITKTDCEPVGTKLDLKPGVGGVGKRFPPVSARTGTTVQVSGLFYNMPPRKQLLLKENKATMARIKELLVAYVLANANLRICFKVTGDEKQSCQYGQTRDRDMKQAILEVFGATVAANGETHRFAQGPFTLLAFLPSLACDQSVIKGKGAFISINGRHMSLATGIGKALTKVFKTKMHQMWQKRGLPTVQQPLLVLAVTCPLASYDVNITTMKDDVLFADQDAVVRAFEGLCVSVYDRAATEEACGRKDNLCEGDAEMVAAQMRMGYRVNMMRTNSNATDEDTDVQSIEILIPARRATQSDSTLDPSEATPKAVRGIERYFQPAPDFEIATDASAMPETPTEAALPRAMASSPCRMPLGPVTPSTLNSLAGIQASPAYSEGDGPRLSDLHSTSWSIQSLLGRSAPMRGRVVESARLTESTSGSPRPLRRGAQRQQMVNARPAIHTPPPSDPIQEEGFVLAREMLRRDVRQPSPLSSPSVAEEEEVVTRRGLPVQRVAADIRRTVAVPRAGEPRAGYTRDIAPRPRRAEHESSHREPTTVSNEVSGEVLQGCVGGTRGHRSRAESMYDEAELAGIQPYKRPCIEENIYDEIRPRGGSGIYGENVGEQRLEVIPPGMATWDCVCRVSVRIYDIRAAIDLYRDIDMYIQRGELVPGLSSLPEQDARLLEHRLEMCRRTLA